MNPSTPVALVSGGVMHDIRPPMPNPPPVTNNSELTPIKAEVVDSIPVRNPDADAQPVAPMAVSNPVATGGAAPVSQAQPPKDHELDKILQSINQRVKASEPSPKQPTRRRRLPAMHLLPIVAALLVAAVLAAAAVKSFHQPTTTAVRTRATSAVTP